MSVQDEQSKAWEELGEFGRVLLLKLAHLSIHDQHKPWHELRPIDRDRLRNIAGSINYIGARLGALV